MIKKLRLEKGYTQEQFGALVGVTTQAVSRWERGGAPDVELLPEIAKALDVTIDALFGREEQSMAVTITKKLCRMPTKDAYKFAFDLCWAIELGLVPEPSMIDDFLGTFIEKKIDVTDKTDYFCKMMQDGGVSNVRLSPDLHHFFLMIEPEGSLRENLSPPDQLRKVFGIFADKKLMNIIYYMYSRLNTPLATSLISKNTGLDRKEVDRCMDILCENNLATKTTVATAEGDIHTYMFHQESSVIPLLCFADEICRKDFRDFLRAFDRTKPLLATE